MHTSTISSGNRSRPSNVIPFLAARPQGGCSPLALAAALRRLHQAGLRGGFVLLAPVSLDPAAGTPEKDPAWWSQLCDRIREQTRLRVAVIDVPQAPASRQASLEELSGGQSRLVRSHQATEPP